MQTSLQDILQDLNTVTSGAEKTAEQKDTSSKVAEAEKELVAALERAETEMSTSKVAEAQTTPKSDLEKIASDLVAAENEAIQKEANFYGAAVADGFMARINTYNDAAVNLQKTAEFSDTDVEKIASEAIRGYVETKSRMEKEASDEYVRGYNDTLAQVEKVAADVFTRGAADCVELLKK